MRLVKLFQNVECRLICGTWDVDVCDIVYDSRINVTGTVFVCLKGIVADGHDFINDVIKKGALAVVVEQGMWKEKCTDVTVIEVKNTRDALGEMSRAFFDFPENQLIMIGITGTKGKTTVTAMLSHILNGAGITTGTIGTLGVCMGKNRYSLKNTTPEAYLVQKYLRDMVNNGYEACVMEVSSQGLMYGRVCGMMFDCGVITNIYPDHIGPGEHKDFEEYKYWKGQMLLRCHHCIVNGDDVSVMEQVLKNGVDAETFFMKDYVAQQWELNLLGDFNKMNALAAAKVAQYFGVCEVDIRKGLENVEICGRCEIVARHNGGLFVIDYAHNGQALKMVLEALRKYVYGRLICVFGCGGNRAKIRRGSMAKAAALYADEIIITSDNPRYEEPMAIIRDIEGEILKQEMALGRKIKYEIIENRKCAIEVAYKSMRPGYVILLAGKGHEVYQEIKGEKLPFNERQIIADLQEKSV